MSTNSKIHHSRINSTAESAISGGGGMCKPFQADLKMTLSGSRGIDTYVVIWKQAWSATKFERFQYELD